MDHVKQTNKNTKIGLLYVKYDNGHINIDCEDADFKESFIDTIVSTQKLFKSDLISSNLTTNITDRNDFYERFRFRMYELRRHSKIDFARSWIEDDILTYRCFIKK